MFKIVVLKTNSNTYKSYILKWMKLKWINLSNFRGKHNAEGRKGNKIKRKRQMHERDVSGR